MYTKTMGAAPPGELPQEDHLVADRTDQSGRGPRHLRNDRGAARHCRVAAYARRRGLVLRDAQFFLEGSECLQIGRSRFSARAAVISFSYSFGRPPRIREDRNREGEEQQPGEPDGDFPGQ